MRRNHLSSSISLFFQEGDSSRSCVSLIAYSTLWLDFVGFLSWQKSYFFMYLGQSRGITYTCAVILKSFVVKPKTGCCTMLIKRANSYMLGWCSCLRSTADSDNLLNVSSHTSPSFHFVLTNQIKSELKNHINKIKE